MKIYLDTLKKIMDEGRIPQECVPKRVFAVAQRFFKMALAGAEIDEKLPENPPAAIHAFWIAMEAMSRLSNPPTISIRQEYVKRFKELSLLLVRLEQPAELTEKEKETTKALRAFFSSLHRIGEDEAIAKAFESGEGIDE